MNGVAPWQRFKRLWVTTGLVFTVVFVAWSLIAYRANAEARAGAVSDATVANVRADGVWRFSGAKTSDVGLLFFPGALVDPVAYAPLARAVAAAGYPVTMVELPRRGAFGGANDPELLEHALSEMNRTPSVKRWVVAGHSRGAVAAVDMAATYPARIAGLALMGTTHPRDHDLSRLTVPVLKIMGTNDGVAPERKTNENRRLLPVATRWVRIDGGNHSQFGWYGFQPGDRFAGISAEQQHARTLSALLDLLGEVAATSPRPGG